MKRVSVGNERYFIFRHFPTIIAYHSSAARSIITPITQSRIDAHGYRLSNRLSLDQ